VKIIGYMVACSLVPALRFTVDRSRSSGPSQSLLVECASSGSSLSERSASFTRCIRFPSRRDAS
jgi:hypothetical protein